MRPCGWQSYLHRRNDLREHEKEGYNRIQPCQQKQQPANFRSGTDQKKKRLLSCIDFKACMSIKCEFHNKNLLSTTYSLFVLSGHDFLHNLLCDFGECNASFHACLLHSPVSLIFRNMIEVHEKAFSAVYDLPGSHFAFHVLDPVNDLVFWRNWLTAIWMAGKRDRSLTGFITYPKTMDFLPFR